MLIRELAVDIDVVQLPHLWTMQRVGEGYGPHEMGKREREFLCNQAAIRETVKMYRFRLQARDELGEVCDIAIEGNLVKAGRPILLTTAVQVAIEHSVACRESGEMRVESKMRPRRSKT